LSENKNEIFEALLLRDSEIKELTDPKGIKGNSKFSIITIIF
jgi:hypothetical protein